MLERHPGDADRNRRDHDQPREALVGTKRWADEEAAARVGDRRQVASAIARAALMTRSSPPGDRLTLAAGAHAASRRVAALLGEAQQPRPALLTLMSALLLAIAVATIVAGKETEHLFDIAGNAYRATHGY